MPWCYCAQHFFNKLLYYETRLLLLNVWVEKWQFLQNLKYVEFEILL